MDHSASAEQQIQGRDDGVRSPTTALVVLNVSGVQATSKLRILTPIAPLSWRQAASYIPDACCRRAGQRDKDVASENKTMQTRRCPTLKPSLPRDSSCNIARRPAGLHLSLGEGPPPC